MRASQEIRSDRTTYRGEFITAVGSLAGEPIMEKRLANAFADTDLEAHLPKDAPLTIAGFMTHNCVASAARAAFHRGYSSPQP